MTNQTADQALVREMNLSMALRLIHSQSPISRAGLAHLTGLNKSTVSSLVDELIARGLAREAGINSAGTGRPATMLELNPNAGLIVGVELGVDFVAVAVTDFLGGMLWRKREDSDPAASQEKTLKQALRIAKKALSENQKKGACFLGLGLATPGTVDLNRGVLIFAPNLHWHNVPFRDIFSKATNLKVFVENDANAAALAEHLFGVARNVENFIFVFAGVGVGGGLFLNGELYRGASGYAGEIGHSPITAGPQQNVCRCGNRGCWETYANQYSVIQRMQARLEVKRRSIVPELMARKKSPLTLALIKEAADSGDAEALESIAEAGRAMGQGFAGLINIFNPEKIILGGPMMIAGEYLLPPAREVIARQTLPEIGKQAEVVLSSFGSDASLFGAIAIVVDDVLSHPSQVERR